MGNRSLKSGAAIVRLTVAGKFPTCFPFDHLSYLLERPGKGKARKAQSHLGVIGMVSVVGESQRTQRRSIGNVVDVKSKLTAMPLMIGSLLSVSTRGCLPGDWPFENPSLTVVTFGFVTMPPMQTHHCLKRSTIGKISPN